MLLNMRGGGNDKRVEKINQELYSFSSSLYIIRTRVDMGNIQNVKPEI
jgi:hypothetical protein